MTVTQYNSSVRQMSQSKFNSMKNASGKIPDLANQIVMTNSEDTNISCLRTEVVYDMTSSDASKNWGYPNGIRGNNTAVGGKDFSPYIALIITAKQGVASMTSIMDLTTLNSSSNTYNSGALGCEASDTDYCKFTVNAQKTEFTCNRIGYRTTSGNIVDMNSENAICMKIIGVLKEPSMIYTGDELIAGNGISIENGVISGIKSEIVWSGNFAYLSTEQTMSLDLSKYKYVEFMTSTGNILPMNLQDTRPNGDLYVYLNASSYYNGSWHDGVKCEGTYYYGTKQIKWSGNYCGLAQVRGYWW